MADVPDAVLSAARHAGHSAAIDLWDDGHALVDLAPGDATLYRLALVWLPSRRDDLVLAYLGHGATELPTRQDDGTPSSWAGGYLEGKLGLIHGNGWTGDVLAAFLDGLIPELPRELLEDR